MIWRNTPNHYNGCYKAVEFKACAENMLLFCLPVFFATDTPTYKGLEHVEFWL